jgi:hypothetical protein
LLNLLVVRTLERAEHRVVVFRESTDEGFIITAFVTHRIRSLERKWQR